MIHLNATGLFAQGIPVFMNRSLGRFTKQVRFPRSKRKRVRKKWRRDRANWRAFYEGPMIYKFAPQRSLITGHMSQAMLVVNPPGMREIAKVMSAEKLKAVEDAAPKLCLPPGARP